jgi:cell division protein FtsL
MCVEPTTAFMIASAGSQVMNYQNQKQVQKNQYNAQIRQNEIAKNNAIQRYASEQLKINHK